MTVACRSDDWSCRLGSDILLRIDGAKSIMVGIWAVIHPPDDQTPEKDVPQSIGVVGCWRYQPPVPLPDQLCYFFTENIS